MPDQIYVGNFAKGLKLDRLPFNIDNDSFPTLYNFYSWRGRIKKKRGTLALGRLQRQIQSVAASPTSYQLGPIALLVGFANLFSTLNPPLSPSSIFISGITQATQAVVTFNPVVGSIPYVIGQQVQLLRVNGMTQINGNYYTIIGVAGNTVTLNVNSTAFSPYINGGIIALTNGPSIVPGSINFTVGGNTYTDPLSNGVLVGNPAGSGTIVYTNGIVAIDGATVGPLIGTFSYYPDLPVMGLEDYVSAQASTQYPVPLAFDTTYSYQLNQAATPPFFYSTSYYKGSNNPVVWSGGDYQQFWTTNYPNTTATFSGSLWATNNKPGFHFLKGEYASVGSGTNLITFNFKNSGANFTKLVVGDQLFFNEWASSPNLNNLTGKVTDISGAAAGNYVVQFASNQNASGAGIVQMLTNSLPGQDGIRWYDGDPTNGTGIPTGTGLGWVNFAPPLTALTVSIDSTPIDKYYLVGALAILPFKDRLLFFSPYIQSTTGAVIQLQDTVLWSWNGTPYYNAVVPLNQTFDPTAYYVDQTGKGGYLPAGIADPIITVSNNEDVLLIGFGGGGRKTRFVYTGNDLQPFLFFNINSELPSSATFSSVALDRGAIDIGQYGISMTDQQSSQRIDLEIPDSVFQIQALNNGMLRVNAIRDFYKEWIYFSYPLYDSQWKFPTQTFLFNYRDNTWAILYENFTTHGNYRAQKKRTWATTGFKSWSQWREPWNAGSSSPLFTSVIAGNPQGFVLIKGQGTGEAPSGAIAGISNNNGNTQITSINHCVSASNSRTGQRADYLFIQGALGILSSTITGITLGTQTILNSINTYSVGQNIFINGINGTFELNGNTYTITAVTGTTITIDVNSTAFTAYVSGGTTQYAFNGQIGRVINVIDANNFVIDLPFPPGIYTGLGTYTRLIQPFLQTKQLASYWDRGRKIRLCVQKYLMDRTANSQVTVNIYLSQDPNASYNNPVNNEPPNSLIYSQLLYTCPESTNIGLTPANTNLQMPGALGQFQIWHRFNTSLIGDSVQIGITLSDAQMKNLTYATSEVTLHGIHLTVEQSQQLC